MDRAPQRDKSTGLRPELLAVHPLGKAPVITDGDNGGRTGPSSSTWRTADDGRLRPAQHARTPAHTYWLHYAEGTFMPLMILSLIMRCTHRRRCPSSSPVARGIVAARSGYLTPTSNATWLF
jgi:glutathione S-transferase